MAGNGFMHSLYLYDDDVALAGTIAPLLTASVEREQAALAVFPEAKCNVLREALGDAAAAVAFTDSEAFYTRPEAALAQYDAALRKLLREGFSAVCAAGEFPACTSRSVCETFATYEAIINRAFSGQPVSITCTYDTRTQPDAFLAWAERTHPHVVTVDGPARNAAYDDPAEVVRALTPDPAPVSGLRSLSIEGGPPAIRERLATALRAAGIGRGRSLNFILAVDEVVDNAERHGGGLRSVRTAKVGEAFVCEVSDHGRGLRDPLAGHLPPDPTSGRRSGLWLARQLTRRLEVLDGAPSTLRLWG